MFFKNPYFLLCFIPLIVIFFFARTYDEKKVYHLKTSISLPEIKSLKMKLFNIIPLYFRFFAAALIIIALARPQKILKSELPTTEGVDIMLTLDTSPSMLALDFEPQNRIEAAKKNAIDFIMKRENDRIGLVVFGGVALLSCPLTLDYQTLIDFISGAYINMTQADGTAIGDAIATAVNHLKDSKAKSKIIILLTDGNSNTGIISDPVLAANMAKEFGIKIYTIGVAKKGESKIPTGNPYQPFVYIKDDLNEALLMEISKITGGEFYRATNYVELQEIYNRINELEKTKFERKSSINYTDLYHYFLIPAMVLVFLVLLLEKTIFLTVP